MVGDILVWRNWPLGLTNAVGTEQRLIKTGLSFKLVQNNKDSHHVGTLFRWRVLVRQLLPEQIHSLAHLLLDEEPRLVQGLHGAHNQNHSLLRD